MIEQQTHEEPREHAPRSVREVVPEAPSRCGECGAALVQKPGPGRPRKFCGTRCRDRAYKRQRRAEDRSPKGPAVGQEVRCPGCGRTFRQRQGRVFCSFRCQRTNQTKRARRRYREDARRWRRVAPVLRELQEDARGLVGTVSGAPRVRDVVQRLAGLDLTED